MSNTAEALPLDLAAGHAMILAEQAARLAVESDRRALDIEIERLKLEIAQLKRERFGQSAERGSRIEQLVLTRSPGFLGISEGATTEQAWPISVINR